MARRLTDTYFVECEYFYTIKQNGNESKDDGYYKFLIEVNPQDHIITALKEAIVRHIKSTENLGYDAFITIRDIYISKIIPL